MNKDSATKIERLEKASARARPRDFTGLSIYDLKDRLNTWWTSINPGHYIIDPKDIRRVVKVSKRSSGVLVGYLVPTMVETILPKFVFGLSGYENYGPYATYSEAINAVKSFTKLFQKKEAFAQTAVVPIMAASTEGAAAGGVASGVGAAATRGAAASGALSKLPDVLKNIAGKSKFLGFDSDEISLEDIPKYKGKIYEKIKDMLTQMYNSSIGPYTIPKTIQ